MEMMMELIEKNKKFIYYMIIRYGRNLEEQEEDLYQDIVFHLYRKRQYFDPTRSKFTTWSGVVIKNLFYHKNDRNKNPRKMISIERKRKYIQSLKEDTTENKDYSDLYDALDKLEPTQKEVIYLVYFEGQTREEVRKKYNISKNKMQELLEASRIFLKKYIEKNKLAP